MGKYWFMVLLFLGVTAIGCQGDHTGEDSRAYAEDEAGSEAVNTLVSGSTTAFWQNTSVLKQEWICLYW